MVNRPIYRCISSLSASELDLVRASGFNYKPDAFCLETVEAKSTFSHTNILQNTLLVHIYGWFCDQCVVD